MVSVSGFTGVMTIYFIIRIFILQKSEAIEDKTQPLWQFIKSINQVNPSLSYFIIL